MPTIIMHYLYSFGYYTGDFLKWNNLDADTEPNLVIF